MKDNNDKLININIYQYMINKGCPKKIVLYTNKLDKDIYTNHSLPFVDFMNKQFPNVVKPIFFNYKGTNNRNPHCVQFPKRYDFRTAIKNELNN
jgi:hypothetical protein